MSSNFPYQRAPFVISSSDYFNLFNNYNESLCHKLTITFCFVINQTYSGESYKQIKRKEFKNRLCIKERWVSEQFNRICCRYNVEDSEYDYEIGNLIEISSMPSLSNLYRPNWDFIKLIMKYYSNHKFVYFNKHGKLYILVGKVEKVITREKTYLMP